jgi:hypothetical protein
MSYTIWIRLCYKGQSYWRCLGITTNATMAAILGTVRIPESARALPYPFGDLVGQPLFDVRPNKVVIWEDVEKALALDSLYPEMDLEGALDVSLSPVAPRVSGDDWTVPRRF